MAVLGLIGTGAWAALMSKDGFLSLLGVLMPLGSLAAGILAGMAGGRARARRRRASARRRQASTSSSIWFVNVERRA